MKRSKFISTEIALIVKEFESDKSIAIFLEKIESGIQSLGVTHYEAYVYDGHIDFHGGSDFTATVPAKYQPLEVANIPNTEEFKSELLAHQQGKTDYLTFIQMCAKTGIEKWEICMEEMTCIYYDKAGNEILAEKIPIYR